MLNFSDKNVTTGLIVSKLLLYHNSPFKVLGATKEKLRLTFRISNIFLQNVQRQKIYSLIKLLWLSQVLSRVTLLPRLKRNSHAAAAFFKLHGLNAAASTKYSVK